MSVAVAQATHNRPHIHDSRRPTTTTTKNIPNHFHLSYAMRTFEEDETISGVRESNFILGSPVDANAIASAQKIINEKSLHAPGSRSCALVARADFRVNVCIQQKWAVV